MRQRLSPLAFLQLLLQRSYLAVEELGAAARVVYLPVELAYARLR
jgi:hypothetical protein